MIRFFRIVKHKYGCLKGRHIYYGLPNGTGCIACKWREVNEDADGY